MATKTKKKIEAPESVETPVSVETRKVKAIAPRLNVRAKPNLDAKILRVLNKDEVIELETTADGWGKLLGEDAWVRLTFVAEVE